MPQLAKGGKWVFGWCVVGPDREIQVPPEACNEYGFQPGEIVIILRGSRTSGGLAISRQDLLARSRTSLQTRLIGQARIGQGLHVALPEAANVQPGECLLEVRGSGLALGLLRCGPVYYEAVQHPEVNIFEP